MKGWKSVVCFLLCVVMAMSVSVCFTSCGEQQTMDLATRAEKIEAEKKSTFQVMRSGVDRSNEENPVVKAVIDFEKNYGRSIDFITCGYDEWDQKVMASIASGSPIDVVDAGEYQFPLYAMKQYAQPIDTLVDLNSEYLDKEVSDLFLYQGKHYVACPGGSASPLTIYYNKNMFENEGVEDPLELYNSNQWTFDKFREIAMKFTRDTNGDGEYDQWGLTCWYTWVFFGGAAASVCKINDQGKFELNMDNNPALVEALEFLQDGYFTTKWRGQEGGDIFDSFYRQKDAMINEFSWAGDTIIKAKEEGQFSFDVGAVSFPYGNNNPDRLNYVFLNGFAILNGCKCPNSAGALVDLIMKYSVEDGAAKEANTPQEWLDLYKDMRSRPFNSSMPDNAIDGGKDLCAKVAGGTDIMAAMEAYKPVYEGLIKEANRMPEAKKEHNFEPFTLDFTKGGTDGVKLVTNEGVGGITNEGDCLKVELDPYAVGEGCVFMTTDPDKHPLWGYKPYKITIEYKVDEVPGDVSVYVVEMKRENLPNGSTAVLTPDPLTVGEWTTAELELTGMGDNDALSLYFMATYSSTIYIKSIAVEEIKD